MAESKAQDYAQRVRALTANAEKLPPEAEAAIARLLTEASRSILADIAATDPGSYTAARLRMLKVEIDRAMDDFRAKASSQVEAIQEKAFTEAGNNVASTVAAATGGYTIAPVLDRSALIAVQSYTADLIGGLSADGAARINAAVQRAYLGGSTLGQLVEEVGHSLEGGKFTGLFGPMGRRAMDIATNEVMRTHSIAADARIQEMATRHPKLMKQWVHLPVARVPRITHILADGQVRKPDEDFDIGGEALRYPRDPAGSPENTINCHCLVSPYFPPEALKPTDAERAMLDKLGIKITLNKNS